MEQVETNIFEIMRPVELNYIRLKTGSKTVVKSILVCYSPIIWCC